MSQVNKVKTFKKVLLTRLQQIKKQILYFNNNQTFESNVACFHHLRGKIKLSGSYADAKIYFLQIFHANLVKNEACAVYEEQNYH